jgi:hypothetical protein
MAPSIMQNGGLACGLQVASPGSATVTAGSGNEITFALSDNGTATLVAEEIFLIPAAGETAVSAADAGDTLSLSASTLAWGQSGSGCSSFSGTR